MLLILPSFSSKIVPLEKFNGDNEAELVIGRLSSAESIAKPT